MKMFLKMFIFLSFVVAFVVGYFYLFMLPESRKQSDTLVLNIESYYLKNGEYPYRLENLIPEYYDEIPTPDVSLGLNQYLYKRDSMSGFLLSYEYGIMFTSYKYSSKTGHWDDQK